MRAVFVAGASGAIGRRLCPLLIEDGWRVVGATRNEDKAARLRELGVEAVLADVFDASHLNKVVAEAGPQVVVHQLTDLPPGLDPAQMAEGRIRNARIRETGTRNLIAAAVASGVGRMVVQSIAFAYALGPRPYRENSPLNVEQVGVVSLETQVLAAPLTGIVLRYGFLYGPGTGFDDPEGDAPLHIDAAADAARRAATHGAPGVYNVAEDRGGVDSGRAIRELAWSSNFRL